MSLRWDTGLGRANDQAAIVDCIGHARGSTEGAEVGHRAVVPDNRSRHTPRRAIAVTHHLREIVDAKGVARVSSEGSKADHLPSLPQEGMPGYASHIARTDYLLRIIDGGRGAIEAS